MNHTAHRDNPDGPLSSVCGQICGQRTICRNGQSEIVVKIPQFKAILEYSKIGNALLFLAERVRWYKQRGTQRFLCPFLIFYRRFRSIPIAFQHSLKAVSPCVPHLSVAGHVVKDSPILPSKKSNRDLTAELHLCLQRKELQDSFDFSAPNVRQKSAGLLPSMLVCCVVK